MRKLLLGMAVIFLALAGCTAPATETAAPLAPTETSAPQPTATSAPTPTTEPTLTPTAAPKPNWIAFIGQDGNVRLVDWLSGESKDITTDGTQPSFSDGTLTVNYFNPSWSSDGQYLAYLRQVGQPAESGYSYLFELWLYQPAAEITQQLTTNQRVIGMAWRPGTHWLAVSFPVDEGYFTMRGQVDASKAKGIWAFNADTGENAELVVPQNGYSLGAPQWSRDGRYLFFEEIWNYEGRGYLAYYDFENQAYISYAEPYGFYDLSPDNQTLVYDTLTYAPQGNERIYQRSLVGGEPTQLSPDYAQGYAFGPRFSPTGDQVAYLANLGAPDSNQFTLFVQPAAGGEARSLGSFENGLYLSWLPDGSGVLLSAGPFEARQVLEIAVAEGASRLLAQGDAPALQPASP